MTGEKGRQPNQLRKSAFVAPDMKNETQFDIHSRFNKDGNSMASNTMTAAYETTKRNRRAS